MPPVWSIHTQWGIRLTMWSIAVNLKLWSTGAFSRAPGLFKLKAFLSHGKCHFEYIHERYIKYCQWSADLSCNPSDSADYLHRMLTMIALIYPVVHQIVLTIVIPCVCVCGRRTLHQVYFVCLFLSILWVLLAKPSRMLSQSGTHFQAVPVLHHHHRLRPGMHHWWHEYCTIAQSCDLHCMQIWSLRWWIRSRVLQYA